MINEIINYGIRAVIILMGILMLSGIFSMPNQDDYMMKVMGVVFVLFGLYRIITYRSIRNRYKNRRQNDDD